MDRLWTWTLSDVFYLVASLMVVWVVLRAWDTYRSQHWQLLKKLDEQLKELEQIRSWTARTCHSVEELRDRLRQRDSQL
jgi:hypothetical protein